MGHDDGVDLAMVSGLIPFPFHQPLNIANQSIGASRNLCLLRLKASPL